MAFVGRLRAAAAPFARLRTGQTNRRLYGSAAQLQYEYDDEHESQSEMEDSLGSVSGRGVQWVILGDPMTNRQMYAQKLSQLLQVPHISMGTLVRQELHPRSSIYKQIANAVNQGKLVPQEVIFGLLSKRLEEGFYRGETGFILDGIPRTKLQAEILDQVADIDLVLNFKRTEEPLQKQFVGRQAYHDLLSGCNSMNKPLEEYYKKQKKLLNFNVTGAPGETWQGLLTALHLQHMNALTSSHKLSV
ncbi:probable adenylate kinase 7, mitochondrial [Rutidosis leptorrhynchoides]|uniref:probable adenylate kinase 7, mitochondrial n=1 Tax=Rutidosis leptorrhynchoides TaxID=125765 RepID=UPI003A99FA8D